VSLDPLKYTFRETIFQPMGCCALNFLHALEIDHALLAHTPRGTGVHPKILIVKIKNLA